MPDSITPNHSTHPIHSRCAARCFGGQSLLTLNVFAANERARRFYERAGLAPEMLKYAKPLA